VVFSWVTFLYRTIAESLANDNAKRFVSMWSPERNSKEPLGELNAQFNQQRQMSII